MSQHDEPAADTNSIAGVPSEADQLASLKHLLLSDERAELQSLREQLEQSGVTADELAGLLPKAVWQAASRDGNLSEAMGPLLGEAMKSAIKNDAESIAEAISPIMGPAIRATIQQSIRGMVQSLNKTLEYSVSAKGLKWRWEAFQTGKSFAEVVMLHTLLFRVEQAFLIDRETGLLIKHAAYDGSTDNVDLASGMLTAIQDFVRDSFGATEDDSLSNMSFGSQTVWIETGSHAFLALVIEGEAPSSLRTKMQESLEQIHMRFNDELASYNGDNTPLAAAQPLLEDCLVSVFEEDEKIAKEPPPKTNVERPAWQKALLIAGIAALLLTAWGVRRSWAHQKAQRTRMESIRRQLAAPAEVTLKIDGEQLVCSGSARHDWIDDTRTMATRLPGIQTVNLDNIIDLDEKWRVFLTKLRNTPGLVVTESHASEGQYALSGLRDPFAKEPSQLMKDAGLNSDSVAMRWLPFQSLEPEISVRRIGAALTPNDDIDLVFNLDDKVVTFVGRASADWINQARKRTAGIGENTLKIDFSKIDIGTDPLPEKTPVPASNAEQYLQHMIQRASRIGFVFDQENDQISVTQKTRIPTVAENLRRLLSAAELAERDVNIVLVGTAIENEDANATANSTANAAALGKRRAEAIWQSLQQFDLPASKVLIQGITLNSTKPLTIHLPADFTPEMARRCCLIRVTVAPQRKKP